MTFHCRGDLPEGYDPSKYNFGCNWVSAFMTRHHLAIRRKTNKKKLLFFTVFIKLKIIIFIVCINSQIRIFHRLKPKVVLNILNHQRSNPTQMMKLLLMKVKVVEVKSESATPQLFIDSTIIKIYLYLYFILKFFIHKM